MASLKQRKKLIAGIGAFSAFLICFGMWYVREAYDAVRGLLLTQVPGGSFTRGIGTYKDLWLNGYLGIFFRFKYFGVLNWLSFPMLISFFATIRKRERWQIALGFVLCMSCAFICIRGYENPRYQFTLFPALITLIFLFGWDALRKKGRKTAVVALLICSGILLIASYSSRDTYRYDYRAGTGDGEPGERFPYKMINYIEGKAIVEDDSAILECNQPILYYHTSKKGLSFRDRSMKGFYDAASLEDAFWILKDKLKVRYVLRRDTHGRRLDSIISIGCDLVCEDQGYKLYKVKELPNNLTIGDIDKRRPNFETNFSNWVGRDEGSINDMDKAIAPMVVQGHRGEFTFKRISSGDGNIVRVVLNGPMFNKRSEIQFGYCFKTNGLKLKVKDGDVVSIITRVRLSKRAKKSAELFVQDRTNYWSREKVYWRGSSWHDVLVSKRIRNGFTNICMGIYWEPGSRDEWLDVKLVRIFVSDKNR